MSEVRIGRTAKKDLERIGPGPQRDRVVAGLRRLASDAPDLDIKSILSTTPGWFRLRIGDHRICHSRVDDGQVSDTIYAVERIVPRGDFDAAAATLPERR